MVPLITLLPLIIPSVATQLSMYLKPISNFVHLIPLVVCAPLAHHVAHLRVTPLSMVSLSQSLHWLSLDQCPFSYA
jgi:hypothetical protein